MECLNLGGRWRMRQAGGEWKDALVPGSVYADLMRAGEMPDPFYRENEREAFERMKQSYEYRAVFSLEAKALDYRRALLRFEGLDTLAHVALNGSEVGDADTMHLTWEWDVKPLLRPGENELCVRFDSPIDYVLNAWERSPGWCATDAIPGFAHLRKAHCMFGWDWGPRLPDAGVWRPVSLILTDGALIQGVRVEQEHADGRVRLRVEPEMDQGQAGTWALEIAGPDGETVYEGAQEGAAWVEIPHPRLWWPNGLGDQPLYTLTVRAGDGCWQGRVGLRTLTLCREKDEWGESFCHAVNGVKIFAMGADYIPQDNLLSRVTPQRTRRLLEDAKRAHFNVIRVWGGGYYPEDVFFDLCDELGLLVWQDLMYACAYYDLTPAFERSIRLETEQNVRRIRHHACLALLCGNNEMEQFQAEGVRAEALGHPEAFGPARPSHHADYIKMFEYILPNLCRQIAPQIPYWPASPSSGGAFDEPNDENRGDTHYWDVWHGEKPFGEYRKHFFRYASEFGFQSFPCLKTVETFTLPQDRNIFSRVMERHQRNKAANGKILSYLSQTYRYPSSFDNLLYASQLLQAQAIRCGVEHWRRNRGRCMGAVIWQLNDCWPVASWSSIDYFGRWKALHYAAKRFFAPVLLSVEEEGEHTQNPCINEFRAQPIERSARFNVSNETPEAFLGTVRWALCTPDGAAVESGMLEVRAPAFSAVWLEKRVFDQATLTGHYLRYDLEAGGETLGGGAALFCAPKHFAFEDPKLEVCLEGDEVVVRSRAFASQVWVESDDADLLLSDNAFDMQPGCRRLRVLRGNAGQGLRARSVYDLG